MSLINDALKRAQQSPPVIAPAPLPPLQPVVRNPVSVATWLMPAVVILLVVTAVFVIGWAMAHHSMNDGIALAETKALAASASPVSTQSVQPSQPAPQPAVEKPLPPAPAVMTSAPVPVNPPAAPKLQGIFYSPNAPTAILDGKTVRVGDQFKLYRVKEITKIAVTLVAADGRAIKVVMDN